MAASSPKEFPMIVASGAVLDGKELVEASLPERARLQLGEISADNIYKVRRITLVSSEGALRTIANLDSLSVPEQVEVEELVSSNAAEKGKEWLYVGRNQFTACSREEAIRFRGERLSDAEELKAQLVSPRLSRESAVFIGPGNDTFAMRLCHALGVQPANLLMDRFANSETRIEIHESVRDRHAFVIASLGEPVNEAFMETALLVQALKLADAKRITVVLPYFGYSRQDRKTDTRPPISARVVSDMLKVLGAHQIITLDLHAAQIEGFFDGPFENLSALGQMVPFVLKEEGKELLVVSPDEGGSKRAAKFARDVERISGEFIPFAVMSKTRSGPGAAPRVTFSVDQDLIKEKTCVLVDDMIDTGGSIIAAAQALKEKGARRVVICATHPVCSHGALEKLQSAFLETEGRTMPVIDRVFVTDTLPLRQARSDFLKVISVAPLLAEALVRLDQPMGTLRELKDRVDLGELLPVRDFVKEE